VPGQQRVRRQTRLGEDRKGSKWLRTALIEAASAAARSKGTYFSAQYRGLKSRRGAKKATVAVGHSILVVAYHVLQRNTPYEELGPDYLLLRHSTEGYKRRLVRQLERLGHKVTLEPGAQSA
jgi:transposase